MRISHTKSYDLTHYPASALSWMSKCPVLKHILLTNKGLINYATPLGVDKTKDKHDKLVKTVRKVFNMVVEDYLFIEPKDLCLEVYIKDKVFNVCGRPDLTWLLIKQICNNALIGVVGEVTLSKAIKHVVKGEMVFYITSFYIHYGVWTVGLVVSRGKVNLLIPKPNVTRRFNTMFRNREDLEASMRRVEELRRRKPWICCLCDLKHVCPMGVEV